MNRSTEPENTSYEWFIFSLLLYNMESLLHYHLVLLSFSFCLKVCVCACLFQTCRLCCFSSSEKYLLIKSKSPSKILAGWVTTMSLSLRRFVSLSEFVQGRLATMRLQDKTTQFTCSIMYYTVNNRSRNNNLKYSTKTII